MRAAIVITNYNYARFVSAAILSALEQSEPVSILIVDDGSTDASHQAIQASLDQAPSQAHLKAIYKQNGGQASAFNAAWHEIQQQVKDGILDEDTVVFFLDGDDVLHSSVVSMVLDRMDKAAKNYERLSRIHFHLAWIDAAGNAISGRFPELGQDLPSGDLCPMVCSTPDDIPWQPTSGNAFPIDTLQTLLPMPEQQYRISADHYLSNLSALLGKVEAIDETLGYYRVHDNNGDHRAGFDLQRIHDIITRTMVTRKHLIEYGKDYAIDQMPSSVEGFKSLTTAGLRLVSLRLSDQGLKHPLPNDSLSQAFNDAIKALGQRSDMSYTKKTLGLSWLLVVRYAPKRFVSRLAQLGLTR